ncbi:peptidoglycan hydrolase [Shewanella phage ZP9]|nr:peptidoglycan hydrolase [Shewanella phage ZP9]
MATVTTKGDIVLLALRKAALASNSTLTQPEPEMVDDALTDLELMLAEWLNKSIDIGFAFADPLVGPDTGDDHGIESGNVNAVAFNLAKRILTDNLRPVPDSLAAQAVEAYESLLYTTLTIPSLQRRNDMPVGKGNKPVSSRGRFYIEPFEETVVTP